MPRGCTHHELAKRLARFAKMRPNAPLLQLISSCPKCSVGKQQCSHPWVACCCGVARLRLCGRDRRLTAQLVPHHRRGGLRSLRRWLDRRRRRASAWACLVAIARCRVRLLWARPRRVLVRCRRHRRRICTRTRRQRRGRWRRTWRRCCTTATRRAVPCWWS